MIKISHEVPICLLEESEHFNDIDYGLVHLMEKNPKYFAYLRSAVLRGRDVILDNSIFELGTAFNAEEFVKWIKKLEPTFYIVPDVLEDAAGTIHNFIDFTETYTDLPGCKIGVVQGKTYDELVECYKFMSDWADYIAISFDYSYYQVTGKGKTELERMMNGRRRLIQTLIYDKIWDDSKPVHLLGCSLPQEFRYYMEKGIYNIASLDTSNPIMAGIKGIRYSGTLGLKIKPKGLLADNINIQLTEDQKELIEYNVTKFRDMLN